MAGKNQPDRWEATLLAAVMAVAGVAFLFDRLGSLMRPNVLTSLAIHNSAPLLLVAVGTVLLLADANIVPAEPAHPSQKQGGQHGL